MVEKACVVNVLSLCPQMDPSAYGLADIDVIDDRPKP